MSSLGVGIACVSSVGPRFTLATEMQCLAQSLARRLITPRNSMSWAPNDGTDMRDFLNKANTSQGRFDAQRAAKDECEKDERVQSASVSSVFNFALSTLTLTIAILTALGPFTLVLAVTALTVAIISVGQ